MYSHQIDFLDEQINLKFVSNIHYNFDSRNLFFASEISDSNVKNNIINKVKQDLPELKSVDLEILQFEKSHLNFDGHETHLLGEIEKFLCEYFDETIEVRANSFYKTLQSIGERSRMKSDRITTSEDLLKRKGFSSKEITKLLREIQENSIQKISWDDICIFLNELSLTPIEKIQYKGAFENYIIKRIRTFDQLTDLAFNFAREYVEKKSIDLDKSLEEFVEVFRTEYPEHVRLFSDIEIKTILLWVYCEKTKFQSNDPKN